MAEAASAVNLLSLLKQLEEPAPPIPIAMWPETPGWWVLGALVLALLSALIWVAVERWRRNTYRRAALAELNAANGDPAIISTLLRRTALASWPRDEVAGLIGVDWIRFLETTGRRTWPDSASRALLTDAYAIRPAPSPELTTQAAKWIRAHRLVSSR